MIAINFISSTDKACVLHSKIGNIEIMINNKADEISEELFQSLTSLQISNWVGNINER